MLGFRKRKQTPEQIKKNEELAREHLEKQDPKKVEKVVTEKILKNLQNHQEILKKLSNDNKKKEVMILDIIELHHLREFVDIFENMTDDQIKEQLMKDNIEDVIDLFEQIIEILEKELGEFEK